MQRNALNKAAKDTLWALLGEQLGSEEPAKGKGLPAVPKDERYEAVHLAAATRRLDKAPAPKQVAEDYEETVPEEVPGHVYSEVRRLRCLGLAGTSGKKEFLLTDGDLKAIPHLDKSRGALGTSHLYRLADLVAAARAKHGSVAGMEAAGRAKADKAEQRKQSAADAAEARRQELVDALAPLGAQLSATMLKVGPVAVFLKGGKAAPPKTRLLPFLQLADWAEKHAGYAGIRKEVVTSESRFQGFKVCFREESEGGYFGDYYGKALQAQEDLDDREEEDCVRLACQVWAKGQGGLAAALGHPAMPAEGTPLRAAVEAVLRQRIETSIPDDAGYGYWGDDEEVYVEDQGEASASSPADLAALQPWLRPRLRWLAGSLGQFEGSWLAEACLQPFNPPQGAEPDGAAGGSGGGGGTAGAYKAVFLIGLEEKQASSSLFQPGAGGSAGPSRRSSPPNDQVQSLGASLSGKLGSWQQRKEVMEVTLSLLKPGELPAWVAA
ncbi:hypothetical protein ABPG75_013798 [Micractinium tetrahymenae]